MKIKNLEKIGKEKIALLILAGILLLIATYSESNSGDEKTVASNTTEKHENYGKDAEKEIIKLISNINGVSNVTVAITYKESSEKILEKDSDDNNVTDEKQISSSSKTQTIILNSDGQQVPYVVKEIYPKINGIAVVAKGVSTPGKKQQIINMLSTLYDVEIHKIAVVEAD